MVRDKKGKVICVLGMHRSGTSMLMRLLNICGVSVGKHADLVPAKQYNKKGYWESKQVLRINEEILKIFDGWWNNPPVLKDGWENDPRLDDLYSEAEIFVDSMNNNYDVWGFKEPRTCLTLPFWQKIIPNMIYVVSFRSPDNVAKSLQKRGDMISSDGILLWSLYWKSILKYTKNRKRHFVYFDNLFSNWQKELGKIMRFIDEDTVTTEGHFNEIKDFISPDLRHNKVSVEIGYNVDFDNMTNKTILEFVQAAFLKRDDAFIQSRVIQDKNQKIDNQKSLIQNKNELISKQKKEFYELSNEYEILKKSKSFRLGDLLFRSIKNPFKLITLPLNTLQIIIQK